MQFPAELLAALTTAKKMVVLTGAGVSAESSIPTFRDTLTGLWERFRAEDLATAAAFRRDPALVWGWYRGRRDRLHPGVHRQASAATTLLLKPFWRSGRDVSHRCTNTIPVGQIHPRPFCRGDFNEEVLSLFEGIEDRPVAEQCRTARQVLAIRPENIEALTVLGVHAESVAERLAILSRAVRIGAEVWKPARGVDWWVHQGTRPFMRALCCYGCPRRCGPRRGRRTVLPRAHMDASG